jgi:hypothetical protein
MQQLTLQFEGFADSRQPETRSTAKQCHRVKLHEISVGWALMQVNASAALQQVVSRVKLFSQGAFCVAFGISLMFLAAIMEG